MRSRWLRALLTLVAVLVTFYVVLVLLARPAAEHAFFAQFRDHRPLVMAHRGGKGLWPENTLYAFEQATLLGVDVLEMDLHSTADGALVVLHDSTVDRTTDGTGPIHDLTLVQAQALELAALNGKVLFFGGLPADKAVVGLDTNIIHYKLLTVTGMTRSSLAQYRKTLDLIADGLIKVDDLISSRSSVDDIQTTIENVARGIGLKSTIVFA